MIRKGVVFICLVFLVSCNSGSSKKYDSEMLVWERNYVLLKEEIIEYAETVNVPAIPDRLVSVNCQILNDTTRKYTIGYCINIVGVIYDNPQQFFKAGDYKGYLSIEGLTTNVMDDETLISIMKSDFPDQYKYYKAYGEYPPPITAEEVLWEVTVQTGRIINKSVLDYIIY